MSQRLYDTDFFAWTQEQAEAIRAGRAGENVLDRENVAEEIESLGKSQRSACKSHIELLFEHLLKIEHVPQPENLNGWRKEVRAFRKNLEDDLSPSLLSELSRPEALDERFARARKILLLDLRGDQIEVDLPFERPYDWGRLTDLYDDWFPEPRYAAQ